MAYNWHLKDEKQFFLDFLKKILCVAEFWTRIRLMLKPSPSVTHFILTHFPWFWSLINNSFLRDTFMRLVLTGR